MHLPLQYRRRTLHPVFMPVYLRADEIAFVPGTGGDSCGFFPRPGIGGVPKNLRFFSCFASGETHQLEERFVFFSSLTSVEVRDSSEPDNKKEGFSRPSLLITLKNSKNADAFFSSFAVDNPQEFEER